MRIWTYLRPFSFRDEAYTVEVFFTFTHTVSRLFLGDRLLDEQSVHHMNGIQVLVHSLTSADGEPAKIEVGYVNWWSVGIAVFQGDETIYESHPGKNVRFAQDTIPQSVASTKDTREKAYPTQYPQMP